MRENYTSKADRADALIGAREELHDRLTEMGLFDRYVPGSLLKTGTPAFSDELTDRDSCARAYARDAEELRRRRMAEAAERADLELIHSVTIV